MQNTEIIYVCNSINNKNIRANELKILEKHPEELYFIFGENNENAKKRYYKDIETLNKDYEAVKKLKEKQETKNERKNLIADSEHKEKNNFDK